MSRSALGDLLHAVSAPCREHPPMMHDVIDHRASWGKRLGLRIHLLLCGPCKKLMAQLRFVTHAARRADAALIDRASHVRTMPDDVRQRIENALRRQGSA